MLAAICVDDDSVFLLPFTAHELASGIYFGQEGCKNHPRDER